MEKYVSQLIEDIIAAKNNVPLPPNPSLIDEERYPIPYLYELENSIPQKMSALFGLKKEQFPPAERLTEAQIESLVDAMIDLWAAFNFAFAPTEEVPTNFAYNLIVNELDEEHTYISEGTCHIDFCTGNTEGCALGEYCYCLQHQDEWEKDYEEWESRSEEEKQASLDEFHRKVAENQRRLFENGFDFGGEKGKDDDVF